MYQSEQRYSAAARTLKAMQLTTLKAGLATIWVSTVVIAGFAGNLDSPSRWAVLVGFAVFPPLVMAWRLNAPVQTMSESIQQARR